MDEDAARPDRPEIERRGVLTALAFGGLAGGTAARATGLDSEADALLTAFRLAWATTAGSTALPVERRLSFLTDAAIVIDDDTPFVFDKPAYADHLTFHAANWERIEWLPHGLAATVQGTAGIVSTNYIERGKPRNAGFRLRAGYCTAVCTRGAAGWQAVSVHMAPLSGQLIDASPG